MASKEQYIAGGLELSKRLLELGPKISKKYLRSAVGSGARIVRDKAIENAPYYHGEVSKGHPPPGTLKHAIIMKFIPERSSSQQVMFYVTLIKGKHGRAPKKVRMQIFHLALGETVTYDVSVDAYYWFMVEFGIPQMDAHPFMRPAFESEKGAALDAIMRVLAEGVEKEAAS